jgi:hypothetical protein
MSTVLGLWELVPEGDLMISQHHSSRAVADEVSEALGDRRYAEPYYWRELRDQILGPHSRRLIPVSRHYMKLDPQVVVDFEPDPLDGKFYVDEKRKFLGERGIVYVPIFLGESLTQEQFLQRVREERRANGGSKSVSRGKVTACPPSASRNGPLCGRSGSPGKPVGDGVPVENAGIPGRSSSPLASHFGFGTSLNASILNSPKRTEGPIPWRLRTIRRRAVD